MPSTTDRNWVVIWAGGLLLLFVGVCNISLYPEFPLGVDAKPE